MHLSLRCYEYACCYRPELAFDRPSDRCSLNSGFSRSEAKLVNNHLSIQSFMGVENSMDKIDCPDYDGGAESLVHTSFHPGV